MNRPMNSMIDFRFDKNFGRKMRRFELGFACILGGGEKVYIIRYQKKIESHLITKQVQS